MTGSALGRAREVAVNARLTARTVAQHVTDDPVVFWLQVSRRLPRSWSAPAARLITHLPGHRALPARATAHHVLGEDDVARTLLQSALLAPGDAAGTLLPALRHGADAALAMGDTRLTADLLAALPGTTRGTAATRARLAWHHGDVDGAVHVLRTAQEGGHGTRGERTLLHRLVSERDLLGSFTPRLAPVTGYTPRARTVLYAVTNSLPHTTSGYAQRSHSYLTALRDEGWEVHAATRPGYPVQVGKVFARHLDVVDGVPYHRILPPRLASTATGRVQQHAEALLELALRVRPAVLHTTSHYVNALAVRAVARALGIPWVYEVRGLLADTWAATRGPEALGSTRYQRFQAREAHAALSADRVVTLGAAMADRLRELAATHGTAPGELRVDLAPNGVGGAFTAPHLERGQARAALGLETHRFVVGTVTSVVDYEGLDDLLRAASLLRERVPSLVVRIVGDGVARPALENLARELGIESLVTFTGRVDRTSAPVYAAALDVFAIPRKDRSVTRAVTPLKPVEAMAAGTTVVASDLPALRETVHHGDTGLLVPPEDPAALAGALRRLAEDPRLAASLASAGRAWVLEHRTWRAVARQGITRYGEVTANVPRTGYTSEERPA